MQLQGLAMYSLQDIAIVSSGLMLLFGGAAIAAFLFYRPSFGARLKSALAMVALGLTMVGLFQLMLFFDKTNHQFVSTVSSLTIVAALAAMVGSAMLSKTAFQSKLISALHHRVEAHRRTLDRLRRSRSELQQRVEERSRKLQEQEKRLRIALRDSNISVAMQDTDLRYVWLRNSPAGFSAPEWIGKRDDEVLPPEAALVATLAKNTVLDTGEDVTVELCVAPPEEGGRTRFFDLTSEPYYEETGELQGLLSVFVETTEKRHREELLKTTLLEVSHRTKNQMAVLMSIARRLAQANPDVPTFLAAFEARMRALSICQDVLVEHDWSAPGLERLIRAQLEPYLPKTTRDAFKLTVSGPEVFINPAAVQNLGLVIHEMILNARDSGLMRSAIGKLDISWRFIDREDGSIAQPGTKPLVIEWKVDGAKRSPEVELSRGSGIAMAQKLAQAGLGGGVTIASGKDALGLSARIEVGRSSIAS